MPQISEPETADLDTPVREPIVKNATIERAAAAVEAGIALALSGGGYRAMLFHIGAIWRLKELQILGKVKRVSSVSGGSITAGQLAIEWNRIDPDSADTSQYVARVVVPLRELASTTIDVSAVGWGALNPFRDKSEEVAAYYRRYLFGNSSLQDLPTGDTRFIITAMSVQTGALWRFSRPYMGDYRVGLFSNPEVDIATAVAASSAFPPFLSPVTLDLSGATPQPGTAGDLHVSPYTETAVLTDGGVYDNLGLEPVWKRFDTILASDGGRRMMAEPSPATDWARHSRRSIDLLQSQTRSLRRRQLIGSLDRGKNSQNDREEMIRNQGRLGAYWGIQTNIDDYQLPDALPAPARFTSEIAAIETRLAALENQQQEHLINWGYAVCDAAVRSANVGLPLPPRPPRFPYQRGVM